MRKFAPFIYDAGRCRDGSLAGFYRRGKADIGTQREA